VFSFGAEYDDTNTLIAVQRFESLSQLFALRHGDNVQRWALQDDVGALAGGIECNPEAVRVIGQIRGKRLFAFGHNL
jgi:hypothetical protein